ncbi:MAG: heme exporter protein CcmD [Rhodobacteraceae bacterium]|nr:heme exporter protein CcmD [Paracoccaceae bacterium]
MIPDLGKYASQVLAAYGVSVALIVGLVVLSLRQSARVRRTLREVEERNAKRDG